MDNRLYSSRGWRFDGAVARKMTCPCNSLLARKKAEESVPKGQEDSARGVSTPGNRSHHRVALKGRKSTGSAQHGMIVYDTMLRS
jgi:hypothetical protein